MVFAMSPSSSHHHSFTRQLRAWQKQSVPTPHEREVNLPQAAKEKLIIKERPDKGRSKSWSDMKN